MKRHQFAKGVILILATVAGLYAFAQRRDNGANQDPDLAPANVAEDQVAPNFETELAPVPIARSPLYQTILERIPLH